jgi:hypothetical protein
MYVQDEVTVQMVSPEPLPLHPLQTDIVDLDDLGSIKQVFRNISKMLAENTTNIYGNVTFEKHGSIIQVINKCLCKCYIQIRWIDHSSY